MQTDKTQLVAISELVRSALTEEQVQGLAPQQQAILDDMIWEIVDEKGLKGLTKESLQGAYKMVTKNLFPDGFRSLS